MDNPPVFRKALIICLVWLALATPTFAQGPDDTTGNDLYGHVVGAVAPVVDFLDDYATLAQEPINASSDIWGAQLLSSADTGEGPGTAAPPSGYYDDAPTQIRQAGYTLEGLTTADIGAMSAFDFAHWLGNAVALPFQLARGIQVVIPILGPMGIFLSWLMLAALWVGIMYFLSFLIGFVKNLLELGSKVIQAIELFKP